jgi:hypothetical protein
VCDATNWSTPRTSIRRRPLGIWDPGPGWKSRRRLDRGDKLAHPVVVFNKCQDLRITLWRRVQEARAVLPRKRGICDGDRTRGSLWAIPSHHESLKTFRFLLLLRDQQLTSCGLHFCLWGGQDWYEVDAIQVIGIP